MPNITVAYEHEEISVPMGLSKLAEFRRWLRSGKYPEKKRIDFIAGDVWIQPSYERLLHNEPCMQLLVTLGNWQREKKEGSVLKSMRYTNLNAELSTVPDLMYFSSDSIKRHEVELPGGNDCVEVVGSPELLVEVSSKFTYQRDTTVLRQQYWQAGVKEYWIVDSRKTPNLTILKRGATQFLNVHNNQGWLTSEVLQSKCCLVSSSKDGSIDPLLNVKPIQQWK